jgi:hypothetical protein
MKKMKPKKNDPEYKNYKKSVEDNKNNTLGAWSNVILGKQEIRQTYCALCNIWVSIWDKHIKTSAHQTRVKTANIDILPTLPQELIKEGADRNIGCPHCGWTGNQGEFEVTGLETQDTICPKCGGEFYDGERDNAEYTDVDCEEETEEDE